MSKMPTIIEQELNNLQPTGIEEDFLARLTACAEGSDLNLSEDEAAFETRLRTLRPRRIPNSLQNSLLDALGDTPFAMDEKIVLFNKPSSGAVVTAKKRSMFRLNIAAAAGVALLGSLAALLVPAKTHSAQKTATVEPVPSYSAPIGPSPSAIAPASFDRELSGTRDEGVIWRGKNEPHRVLRLTYMDQATVTGADGKPRTTMRPRVEYVIIPEKID
ncbi:MAG: hypothetical protein RLZZ505_2914 [Verrucomicrobiota bacterium]|jgi:hypothetical protein